MTSVYTGMDGSISVAVETGVEGDAAAVVADEFGLTPIGRATDVRVEVVSDVRAFHEIGQRYPTDIRYGNINVSGSIGRAYVNGALLRLMLGEGAAGTRPAGAFVSPTFNLSLRHENPALPDNASTIAIHGVKIDSWSHHMPEDDFVLEGATFKALWISAVDESG